MKRKTFLKVIGTSLTGIGIVYTLFSTLSVSMLLGVITTLSGLSIISIESEMKR